MNIGQLLKTAGHSAIKELPLGSLVVDVVELVAKTKVDRETVTGNDLEKILDNLPLLDRTDVLQRTFDTKLSNVLTLDHAKKAIPKDTELDRARVKLGMAATVVSCLLSSVFIIILFYEYLKVGTVPTVDVIAIVLGLPTLSLFVMFGFDSRSLLSILLATQARKVSKK